MNVTLRDEYLPLTPQVLQILLALAAGPRYGYAVLDQVAYDSEQSMVLRPSTVYPALGRLVKAGLAESYAEYGRSNAKVGCYYQLTHLGKTVLEAEITRLKWVVNLAGARLQQQPKKELESSFLAGLHRKT